MTCNCKFCRGADRLFEREAELADESAAAQEAGDYGRARRADDARAKYLGAAMRAVDVCRQHADQVALEQAVAAGAIEPLSKLGSELVTLFAVEGDAPRHPVAV